MISDILTSIRGEISTFFPNKKELINHEAVSNNPIQYLEDGYSIKMGAGTRDNLNSTVMTSMTRTVELVLTKGFVSSDINLGGKKAAESSLINEMEQAINLLKQSGEVRKYVIDINYESDSGQNLLEIKKLTILLTKVSMTVRYIENF